MDATEGKTWADVKESVITWVARRFSERPRQWRVANDAPVQLVLCEPGEAYPLPKATTIDILSRGQWYDPDDLSTEHALKWPKDFPPRLQFFTGANIALPISTWMLVKPRNGQVAAVIVCWPAPANSQPKQEAVDA